MNDITLKPTAVNLIRYRLISSLAVMPVAIALVVFLISTRLNDWSWRDSLLIWLTTTAAGILGAFVGQLLLLKKSLEALNITIADGQLLGPGSWVWQRKRMVLSQSDKTKSAHRSLYQQLFGLRRLWFRDGEAFEICELVYQKEDITKLLDILHVKT